MAQQDIINLILLISPILIIQLGVAIFALLDLHKRSHVKGKHWMWALGLILTVLAVPSGLIVAGVYLVWGRNPDQLTSQTKEIDE